MYWCIAKARRGHFRRGTASARAVSACRTAGADSGKHGNSIVDLVGAEGAMQETFGSVCHGAGGL